MAENDVAERLDADADDGRGERTRPLSPANERPVEYRTGTRKCLNCSSMFESEWSGERICKKCKGSSTWRSGRA